ncbi:MAG: roadblock/LC7 domain-containing protein [Thermoplasmatota archaeon]
MTTTVELRRACQDVLDDLVAGRDGLPALEAWPSSADVDTVAAMSAALFGAAAASLAEFSENGVEAILVTAAGRRLSVLGVDEEHVLSVVLQREAELDHLDHLLADGLDRLRRELGAAED